VRQVFHYLGFHDCTDTRWLVKKHREKKAAKVLARIYQTDEKGIEEELSGIEATVVNTEKGHFWQKLKVFRSWKFIQRSASQSCTKSRSLLYFISLCHRVVLGMWLQIFQRGIGGIAIS